MTKNYFLNTSDIIELFLEHHNEFSDREYWENLAGAYIRQNYKKIPFELYYKLFSSERKYKEYLMTEEERMYLEKLPDEITIYRGGDSKEEKTKKYGVSWTLSKDIAKKFCSEKEMRDSEDMIVMKKKIKKSAVIAYFNQRKEEEIIYIERKV